MVDRIVKRVGYYLNLWLLMSRNSFLGYFWQKKIFAIFLFGKIIRFIFFIAFLYFIIQGADSLAGYDSNQAIFFFLTFNVIDVLSQFLFRNAYRFRPLIVSGDFDLVLTKPMSALFRVLLARIGFEKSEGFDTPWKINCGCGIKIPIGSNTLYFDPSYELNTLTPFSNVLNFSFRFGFPEK